MTPRIVILSAGASSRLGQPKALATLGGRAVLDWMLSAARQALPNGGPALLITGAHHPEISAYLEQGAAQHASPLAPEVVRSVRWRDGRTAGVQVAATMNPGVDLMIWPADVPLVAGSSLGALLQEWDRMGQPARGWLAPTLKEALDTGSKARFGHPVILGAELASEVHGLAPDAPLRALRAKASPLASLVVDDAAIVDDLDTPLDLERLRRRIEQR